MEDMPRVPRPTSSKKAPTPLLIRTPLQEDFSVLAKDLESKGTFDQSLRFIQLWLQQAEKSRNTRDVSYYTRAFRAFLEVKGGSYAILPVGASAPAAAIPQSRARPAPPAPAAALDAVPVPD